MKLDIQLKGFAQATHHMKELSHKLPGALDKAAAQQAQSIRKQMVQGLRTQNPGGKQFQKLSKLTLALRKAQGFRGSKALIRTAALMQSIQAKKLKPSNYFIGVLRGSTGKGGQPMVHIAEIHEYGKTFVIRVTPKMRRWLMMMLNRTKVLNRRRKAAGESMIVKRVIVVKIPARPFVAPVIAALKANEKQMNTEIGRSLAKSMGLKFGGGH